MSRVVVVGSINMDVVAQARRMPNLGETAVGDALSLIPGGKGANQAVAARRSGNEAAIVGAVGSDSFGTILREFLVAEQLDMTLVSKADGSTGTAVIIVNSAGENAIVIIPGANEALTPGVIDDMRLAADDVLLLQNEIPEVINVHAIRLAERRGTPIVLNLAPFRNTPKELLGSIDYLVLNETEFAEMMDEKPIPMSSHKVAGLLAEGAGYAKNVVVTLGSEGLHARLNSSVVSVAGHRVPVVDTTGAGDCFCGTFGTGLAEKLSPQESLEFANAAAALSVQRLGAGPSMPSRAEIESLLKNQR